MMNKSEANKRRGKMIIRGIIVLMALFIAVPAFAAVTDSAGEGFLGLLSVMLLIGALGVGAGAFGFMANHIFSKRSAMSYRVMTHRPGLSFAIGIIVTIVGFGLLALFQGIPPLALIVVLAYTIGLGLCGIGASVRLASQLIEPTVMQDDLPSPWAHIKGGLLLVAVNIIPILGSIFFVGILLASIGATLLGYFASIGGAVNVAAPAEKEEEPVKQSE